MNQTMKQPCRYGIGNASRACILDKNSKFAMWENIYWASCRSSSETTKKLENLLKVQLFSCCFLSQPLGPHVVVKNFCWRLSSQYVRKIF